MLIHGQMGRPRCWCGLCGILRPCCWLTPALTPVLVAASVAGGTWIITIPTLVIVGLGVAALAGGTGFNINKRNMQGAEAVPFINFWRELPGLVKEGSMFSYHHGREFSLMVRMRPLLVPHVMPTIETERWCVCPRQ